MGFWFIMMVGVVELTSLGSVEGGSFGGFVGKY